MTHVDRPRLEVLIIVRADCQAVIPRLRTQFERATIVVDRRIAERRMARRPVEVERRSGRDRRQPTMDPEATLWRQAGYRIVYYSASPRTPTASMAAGDKEGPDRWAAPHDL